MLLCGITIRAYTPLERGTKNYYFIKEVFG